MSMLAMARLFERLFFIVACLCMSVLGWDKDGHEAVGMTAMSALNSKALSQVKRLMGGRDIVDISDWSHKVNKKYPWTTSLHYQAQSEDWSCKVAEANEQSCPGNVCLLPAIKYFYARLTNKKDTLFTQPDGTKVPVPQIKIPDGIKLTDVDSIKFLVALIADLHQPLTLGFPGNGKAVNGTIDDKTMSLFDVWESYLTQSIKDERPGFWLGGWTHVNQIKPDYERDKESWKQFDAQMFDRWVQQSVETVCNKIYKDSTSNERMPMPFNVGPFQKRQWTELWQQQLLIAGARVAIVLNSILEQREATKLRQGSSITVEEPDEDFPAPGVRSAVPLWIKNLISNIGIAALVGLVFYGLTRTSHEPAVGAVAKARERELMAMSPSANNISDDKAS